jgi:hypothetical protein
MSFPMRYFQLRDDMRIPGRWLLGDPLGEDNQEVTSWYFGEGRVLDGRSPLRLQQVHPGHALDFSLTPLTLPVVHEKVVSLFSRLGLRQQVQFIPAHVEGQSEPYFILNAHQVIRCIDDQRSERVDYWRPEDGNPEEVGQYRVVTGLRIDPSKVGDAQVFRPWGWYVALLVSEQLKHAMEQEGLTGPRFIEV